MAKLPAPKAKLSEKDLTKKLAVATEEVVETSTPKAKGGKGKSKTVATTPAPVETPPVAETKSKVTSLADKKKEKAKVVADPAPAESKKDKAKLPKPSTKEKEVVAPPALVDEDEVDDGADEWNEMFNDTIETKAFTYTRREDLQMPEILENLPKFNVHMLMAEQRDDGKFTNMIMCFASKESFTFIDQTGGEDYDSIVQVPHADIIGKREFKVKKSVFPFALYIKMAKK